MLTLVKIIPVSIALDEHEEDMHRGGVEDLKNLHIDHHSMLRANLNKKLGSVKKTISAQKVLNQHELILGPIK